VQWGIGVDLLLLGVVVAGNYGAGDTFGTTSTYAVKGVREWKCQMHTVSYVLMIP
jgi:hypothetical protein